MKILLATLLRVVLLVGALPALQAAEVVLDESEGPTQMVLGAKVAQNPYSVVSMQAAMTALSSYSPGDGLLSNSPGDDSPGDDSLSNSPGFNRRTLESIQATHKYVKIMPQDDLDLDFLEDLDGSEPDIVLHDYPLDYEILVEGDYFVDPGNVSMDLSPVYTVLPVHYLLPSTLSVEVLEYLHMPDDDEDDLENEALASSQLDLDRTSLAILPPDDEYNVRGRHRKLWPWNKRYTPTGCILVWNTHTSGYDEPLQKARISIGWGPWWNYVETDHRGCFRATRRFKMKVTIRAKWKSRVATIRTSWNEILGIRVSDRITTIKRRDNYKTICIPLHNDRLWFKSTVHNGLVKYNDFASSSGIKHLVSGANV